MDEKRNAKRALLSIAGFDPSGGAGVLLDVQVFRSMGFVGMGVPTADTVQNTLSVKAIHPHAENILRRQYRFLKEDVSFSGIKVGMIGSKANLIAVGSILTENQGLPIVVDPVLASSSGYSLLEDKAVEEIISAFTGKATIITPNIPEAERLSGMPVRDLRTAAEAARKIYGELDAACLLKGGHLPGDPVDILFDGEQEFRWKRKRYTAEVHGTGCFLSSAVLGFLAQGASLVQACENAGDWAGQVIRNAIVLGKGRRIIDLTNGEK
jgi:hydroxymethylpyrimidine/phosphomethylpyrimidine kinase